MEVGIHINENKLLLKSRIKYVINFINDHPLSKGRIHLNYTSAEAAKIIYGTSGNKHQICIHPAQLFFNQKNIDCSSLNSNQYNYNNKLYYGVSQNIESNEIQKNRIPFDVFETIFFHISRIEELSLPFKEYVGRKEEFEDQLFLVKHGIFSIPIVDELVALLIELVTGKTIKIKTKLGITHDVDILQKFKNPWVIFKKIGGHFINRKAFMGFPLLLSQYWNYVTRGQDPFDIFDWMFIDQPLDTKEVYILSGGSHHWDTPYAFSSKRFEKLIRQAKERNYTVGIHPSYESWNNEELLQTEVEKFESYLARPVKISRQHFLNFDIQITPNILSNAGIKKDASLGYSRHVGFRCGTGFDYYLYDFEKEQKSDLLESPLIFMDVACLYESGFNKDLYVEKFKTFFDRHKFNTRITCNFHNSFFDEAAMRSIPLKTLYTKLIDG